MTSFILQFTEGPFAGRQIPFTAPSMQLGRSSSADISISDILLSRMHCRFEQRAEELWLVDLESANQTQVNRMPITEQPLHPGDIVTVGTSVIHIQYPETGPTLSFSPDQSEAVQENPPDHVVVDLGFDRPGPESQPHKKNLLRPIMWSAVALLILAAGSALILSPENRMAKKSVAVPLATNKDVTLSLYYEKVEATIDNIFRYELSLTPDGLLAVKIDDLSGQNRHIRKEKKVDPELLAELTREIESSGFFSLEKTFTGFASDANTMNEFYLMAAIGKKVHSCRVTNRTEPEVFRTVREKLETFSKNELGIWAIQFSAEKLTELAKNALDIAKKRFAERDVKYGNLHDALRNYQESIFYLDTVNPKPDFYGEILDGFENAKKALEARHQEQSFLADRAINLADWSTAARELRIICELLPDRTDPRHQTATRKLLDVERRLKQK